ncbi:MAG: transposase family protein [Alphaproteobacteria bacterium]|nr:transposase family protein [Alphaproteobacteria bacterium]
MLNIIKLGLLFFRDLFRSRVALEAEVTLLRHQLATLRRKSPNRIRLTRIDRIVLTLLCHIWPELLRAVHVVQPATVIRWHRMGFRALWRWKSRPRCGRPKVSKEIRDLIREISLANPLWGTPRVHGELKMLGFDIAQSSVAKYMAKRRGPPSQGWKTFLRNHADGIASCDFLIIPTIGFKLLYVFVILGHSRRKLLHIGITANPTAEWAARQITEAFPWDSAPKTLIRDNDSIYGAAFKKQLAALNIRDGPTALRSPWQNGFVERMIGSIKRECLDHMIIRDEVHLRRVLKAYARYYNSTRTHIGLNKDAPFSRSIHAYGRIKVISHLGGLHHEYVRI